MTMRNHKLVQISTTKCDKYPKKILQRMSTGEKIFMCAVCGAPVHPLNCDTQIHIPEI
jgi:hypothetical protein